MPTPVFCSAGLITNGNPEKRLQLYTELGGVAHESLDQAIEFTILNHRNNYPTPPDQEFIVYRTEDGSGAMIEVCGKSVMTTFGNYKIARMYAVEKPANPGPPE